MNKNYKKFLVIGLGCFLYFSSFSQAISEGFDDITTLFANGWAQQNLSSSQGSNPNWSQGDGGIFSANSGSINSCVVTNANSVAGSGTISNWLFAPTRTLQNGDIFTFYTRTISDPQYADNLQVRLSTTGSSVNAGSSSTSVGDFTTLLLEINPTLVLANYPNTWTKYTITLSGLSGSVSGRLAFRYYVTDGGSGGTNSDYIAIDDFVYTPVESVADVTVTEPSRNYTSIPLSQAVAMPLVAKVNNMSGTSISDATLAVNVFKAPNFATPVQTTSSSATTIGGSSSSVLNAGNYTPTDLGSYRFQYISSCTGNTVTGSDTINYDFAVTTSIYSRDDGNISSAFGIGAGPSGYLGSMYVINQETTIDSVLFVLQKGGESGAAIGDSTKVVIYSTSSGLPSSVIGKSPIHLFTPADTLGIITHTLAINAVGGGKLVLTPNTYYFAVEENQTNVGLVFTNEIFNTTTNYAGWTGQSFTPIENFGGSFAKTPLIRPIFSGCTSVAVVSTSDTPKTASSAVVRWTTNQGCVDSATVYFRKSGDSSWMINPLSTYKDSVELMNLMPNTQYEWQVQLNYNGMDAPMSMPDTFMTPCENPLVATGLMSYGISGTSAVVKWASVSGCATQAVVRYRERGETTWQFAAAFNYRDSIIINGLKPNTAYNWKVNFKNGSVVYPLSEPDAFRTLCGGRPDSLINLSTKVVGTSARLKWKQQMLCPLEKAVVQYRKIGETDWKNRVVTPYTDTLIINNLDPNTAYQWQVNARGNGLASFPSVVRNFTSGCDLAPTAIQLVAMPMVSGNGNIIAGLHWRRENNCPAEEAVVMYRPVGSSVWRFTTVSPYKDSLEIGDLLSSVEYEWHVRLKNQGAISPLSMKGSFSTGCGSLLSAPTNLQSVVEGISAQLTWDRMDTCYVGLAVVHYRVVGETNWSFQGINPYDTTTVITNLLFSSQYEWRVRLKTVEGDQGSKWSELAYFSTDAMSGGCDPTPGTLINLSSFSFPDPFFPTYIADLSWSKPDTCSIQDVEVYIRKAGDPNWMNFLQPYEDFISVPFLDPGSTYEWKVRGINGNGSFVGSFSVIDMFTTGNSRIGQFTSKTSTQIEGVYPNPFREQLSINMVSNTASNLSIELYDLQGRLIDLIFKGNVQKGETKVIYDSNSIENGVYFVRIISNDNVTIERVVRQ